MSGEPHLSNHVYIFLCQKRQKQVKDNGGDLFV